MNKSASPTDGLTFYDYLRALRTAYVPDDIIAHRLNIGSRALAAIVYGGARPSSDTLAEMPRVYVSLMAVRRGK